MIVQLDESVPVRLVRVLADLGCRTLRFPKDWKGLKNGELLKRLREAGVTGLITCDKNIRFQQSIVHSGIGIVVLPRQRFDDLLPYLQSIVRAVDELEAGHSILIDEQGQLARG